MVSSFVLVCEADSTHMVVVVINHRRDRNEFSRRGCGTVLTGGSDFEGSCGEDLGVLISQGFATAHEGTLVN